MKESVNRYSLPKVEEMMSRKVLAYPSNATTVDVLKGLNQYRISSAPVVSPDNKDEVVGYISDEDCMNAIANNSFFDDFRNLSLDKVMTKTVLSLRPDMDIYEAESFMRERHLKHAPVVGETGHLVGVISRRDILVALESIVDKMGVHKEKVKAPLSLSEQDLKRFQVNWKTSH